MVALAAVLGQDVAPTAAVAELFDALEATPLIQEQFEVIGTALSALDPRRRAQP